MMLSMSIAFSLVATAKAAYSCPASRGKLLPENKCGHYGVCDPNVCCDDKQVHTCAEVTCQDYEVKKGDAVNCALANCQVNRGGCCSPDESKCFAKKAVLELGACNWLTTDKFVNVHKYNNQAGDASENWVENCCTTKADAVCGDYNLETNTCNKGKHYDETKAQTKAPFGVQVFKNNCCATSQTCAGFDCPEGTKRRDDAADVFCNGGDVSDCSWGSCCIPIPGSCFAYYSAQEPCPGNKVYTSKTGTGDGNMTQCCGDRIKCGDARAAADSSAGSGTDQVSFAKGHSVSILALLAVMVLGIFLA